MPRTGRPLPLDRRFAADRRGATALEFTLLVAPMIALMIAIIEMGMLFFTQQGLDTSAEIAARAITTGTAQKNGMTLQTFRASICPSLPPNLNCAGLMVDVRKAATFSSIDTSRPTLTYDQNGNVTNTFSFDPGGAGDIVIVRLMYLWPLPMGPLGWNLANAGNGNRMLLSTSVAKTEPYA